MKVQQTDILGSFAKGLKVIEAFSAERARLAIADVAALTGFDRATARRCLLTLSALGYADYDGKYFSLTPAVLRLGMASLAAMPLPRIVQPLLDRLSADIGQSTSVSILDGWEIVYVARAARQNLMAINLMPGSRLPAYCTSMGRAMLGQLDETKQLAILQQRKPEQKTKLTLTDAKALLDVFATAKSLGYAIVDQEIEIGLRSIAVPLFNARGAMIGALNVGVAAVQEDISELPRLYLPKLLKVQSDIRTLVV